MKKKGRIQKIGRIAVAIMLAFTVFGTSGITKTVYANDEEDTQRIEEYLKETTKVKNGELQFDNKVKSYVCLEAEGECNNSISIGEHTFYYENSAGLLRVVNKAQDTANVGNKLNEINDGLDIDPDVSGALGMMSGFRGIISLVVGILMVGIVALMAIFTALDICYMAFPIVRSIKDSGEGGAGKALQWVTDDAMYAVKTCTLESGKNMWLCYLGRRAGSYIFLGIILFMLLTNNITLIVDIVLVLVKGIIDALTGLAAG